MPACTAASRAPGARWHLAHKPASNRVSRRGEESQGAQADRAQIDGWQAGRAGRQAGQAHAGDLTLNAFSSSCTNARSTNCGQWQALVVRAASSLRLQMKPKTSAAVDVAPAALPTGSSLRAAAAVLLACTCWLSSVRTTLLTAWQCATHSA